MYQQIILTLFLVPLFLHTAQPPNKYTKHQAENELWNKSKDQAGRAFWYRLGKKAEEPGFFHHQEKFTDTDHFNLSRDERRIINEQKVIRLQQFQGQKNHTASKKSRKRQLPIKKKQNSTTKKIKKGNTSQPHTAHPTFSCLPQTVAL